MVCTAQEGWGRLGEVQLPDVSVAPVTWPLEGGIVESAACAVTYGSLPAGIVVESSLIDGIGRVL